MLIIHLPQSVPKVKTAQEIEGIRRACTMAASVLQAACRLVKVPATSLSASVCQPMHRGEYSLMHCTMLLQPGITTDEIDRAVHEDIISRNAYPAPLNYKGTCRPRCPAHTRSL